MFPGEQLPYQIGGATLVNATNYPSNGGIKIDNALAELPQGGLAVTLVQGGGGTFGTATLQRQLSFDGGVTWNNDGSAVSSGALVSVTFSRRALYRWQVTGTGNITGAGMYVG